MALNLKAKETLVQIGKYMGTYRYVLSPVIYNKLSEDKVVEEACVRSNLAKSVLQSAWNAIGDVIQAWATKATRWLYPVSAQCASASTPPLSAPSIRCPTA